MKTGAARRCGHCHALGHSGRICPKNPESTVRVEIPERHANVVWAERLSGIWRAASYDPEPIRSAMLGAYLQGALDGRRPETDAALTAALAESGAVG